MSGHENLPFYRYSAAIQAFLRRPLANSEHCSTESRTKSTGFSRILCNLCDVRTLLPGFGEIAAGAGPPERRTPDVPSEVTGVNEIQPPDPGRPRTGCTSRPPSQRCRGLRQRPPEFRPRKRRPPQPPGTGRPPETYRSPGQPSPFFTCSRNVSRGTGSRRPARSSPPGPPRLVYAGGM